MKKAIKTLISLAVLFAVPLYADEHTDSATPASNKAKNLFESHCLSCHQPHKGGKGTRAKDSHTQEKPTENKQAQTKAAHTKRKAPPMPMVKKHYLKTYPDRDLFIAKISAWVTAPDANTAILHHAVEKFGLMPPQAIDKVTRQQIAGYIYDVLPAGHGKKKGCKKGGKH